MELGRGGETSEGQATLAFTGNNLMCGHARRGLSKRIQFKLMRWQQYFKIYEFYAPNDFIPSNSARTHSPPHTSNRRKRKPRHIKTTVRLKTTSAINLLQTTLSNNESLRSFVV